MRKLSSTYRRILRETDVMHDELDIPMVIELAPDGLYIYPKGRSKLMRRRINPLLAWVQTYRPHVISTETWTPDGDPEELSE